MAHIFTLYGAKDITDLYYEVMFTNGLESVYES